MSPTDIRQAILEILEDIQPDLDFSQLQDEVPLREQFELDSMDFLDIVMELRTRYRVEVPEEDYGQMRTMASTVAYLEPRMRDLQNV